MEKNVINKKQVQIVRLLDLLADAERAIEISKNMKSDLMIKQAIHFKNKLGKELLELLNKEYKLKLKLEEAA